MCCTSLWFFFFCLFWSPQRSYEEPWKNKRVFKHPLQHQKLGQLKVVNSMATWWAPPPPLSSLHLTLCHTQDVHTGDLVAKLFMESSSQWINSYKTCFFIWYIFQTGRKFAEVRSVPSDWDPHTDIKIHPEKIYQNNGSKTVTLQLQARQ